MEKAELVLPGDEIAVLEEFMPGEGTYEVDHVIFASTLGIVERDMKNRIVSVRTLNPPAKLKIGDVVYGMVTDIRSPIVTVEILKLKHENRQVAGDNIASLHISHISKGYTEDIRREIRIGDFIIAEIIQVEPSLQLTTAKKELGVVRAHCVKCRMPLIERQQDLYCMSCKQSEPRKIAQHHEASHQRKQ